MEKLQSSISELSPNTQLGARQMLEIAVTIMSYPNPEISLGQGPILEIVKRVWEALDQGVSDPEPA